ncbi:histidine phosphatase family protein [Paenibacillus qinlingensis]|uniref:histidine phosphatase family protein n=1 Tax=Paenibacillus qinlingensis TaxID=1837343 RepID=UPI001565434A|nr:histidine phosphatase family protein [Paenibacillus qinlingensis]NQX60002.1 histidine phosphatase family protein [Paenibacillus qinlingensis]
MKIGILRHFEVKLAYPNQRFVSKDVVTKWFADYDKADVVVKDVDLSDIDWEICYSSDMLRAILTAKETYRGEVIESSKLREIPLPTFTTNLKMPFIWWAVAVKLKQLTNHESREQIKNAQQRISEILDQIATGRHKSILIVSHGSLMREMRKELRKRGFNGPGFSYPENGKLYVFER